MKAQRDEGDDAIARAQEELAQHRCCRVGLVNASLARDEADCEKPR